MNIIFALTLNWRFIKQLIAFATMFLSVQQALDLAPIANVQHYPCCSTPLTVYTMCQAFPSPNLGSSSICT